jgi:arylsulfatase A-like enzyme
MPNVVYVHTDDTGRRVGPYGHAVDTPALNALADDGVCFRDCHTAGPTCSPSRAAQFTGLAPHTAGVLGLAHRGFPLEDERHLARHLSEQGFESVLAGQQHEIHASDTDAEPPGRALGYDRVLEGDPASVRDLPIDHDDTRTDLANATAAAEYVRSDPAEPFFLSLGLYTTHQPMPLEQDEIDPDRVSVPTPLPDHPAVRREIAAFDLLVEYVDECVERVVTALQDTGQYEDTIVVFSTDHGPPFPQMKCHLYEGGTGIALLARFPDSVAAARGRTTDALVSNVDLSPTLCDAVDVPVQDGVHGASLLPLVRGETESVREAAFSEVTFHGRYEPKRCVRTDRYTYVRRYDADEGEPEWDRDAGPIPRVDNTDSGPSEQVLREAGLFQRPIAREALYDRTVDPAERDNLARDPAFADVRADLAERLETWMVETGDPLVEGPVAEPADAEIEPRR